MIDTRKGDDVKPFYVNKKLRKVRGYIFIFPDVGEALLFADAHTQKQWEWPEDVQKPEDIAPPPAWDMEDGDGRGRSESHRRGLADLAVK